MEEQDHLENIDNPTNISSTKDPLAGDPPEAARGVSRAAM